MSIAMFSLLIGIIAWLMPQGQLGFVFSIFAAAMTTLLCLVIINPSSAAGKLTRSFTASGLVISIVSIAHQLFH